MDAFTISCSQSDNVTHDHARRIGGIPRSVDPRLSSFNKTIVTTEGSFRDAFEDFFANSREINNSKQKRKDRKIDSYYDKISNGDMKEKPFYHYVLQIGNRETNGILKDPMNAKDTRDLSLDQLKKLLNDSETTALARKALDNAAAKIQERYPSFKFWFIGSHADEPNGTYHYDLIFTPVGTGYKNGMPVRDSFRQAMIEMGFNPNNGKPYLCDLWKKDIEELVQEEMEALGLSRDFKNEHRARKETSSYVSEKEIKDMLDDLEVKQGELNEKLSVIIEKSIENESKEKNLEEQSLDLKSRENSLKNDIIKHDEAKIRLKHQETKAMSRIKERDAELDEREHLLDERETSIETRELRAHDMIRDLQKMNEEMRRAENERYYELPPEQQQEYAEEHKTRVNGDNHRKKLLDKYKADLEDSDYITKGAEGYASDSGILHTQPQKNVQNNL